MAFNSFDTRQVAELLFERYDTLNPMSVRLADMPKWIVDLEDYEGGNPRELSEAHLKAIQKAWYERWKEEFGSP
jgi:FeS assembly protein IscX